MKMYFWGPELTIPTLDIPLDGLVRISANQSVVTREAQSRAECVKSRMANIEDIMVSLVNERCIFTQYILFNSGCSSSQMCTRNSEDSETYGKRDWRFLKFQ